MCGDCKNGHGKSKPCYRPGCNQPSSRRRRAIDSYHQESFQNFLNNINDDVDVSFPVQGNKYLTHHGGIQPYVSVVESTGSVYFTVKKTPSTAHVIVNAAVESIPLLLFILLLSILAGMIIWILERSSNPYSFPLSFVKGVKEGFWWAFISASTVGYGDRRPVTIPGKLFAIIWILIGNVIITLLTSWMVNSITLVLVEQRYSIYGSKIAVVENSTEYGRAVRKNGLVVGYPNVDKVIEALKKAKVDGALLDMYAAATRKDLFSSGEIKLNRQVQYPSGYGIVLSGRMKESAPMIREWFKAKASELFEIIQNNTDVITQKNNRVKEVASIKSGLFDVSSRAFRLSIVIIFSMLAFCFLAGLYWQYKYHYKASKLRLQLQSEAPSYPKYKILREDFKRLHEEELKDLKNRLIMLKAKHMKELKLLTKLKKESVHSLPTSSQNKQVSGSVSFVRSTLRLPRCSASVAPISNSQTNIALKVMDLDEGHGANKLSEDSEV